MDPFDRVVSAFQEAPVRTSSMTPIVLFHTHWEKLYDGWSVASRAYAKAMEMAGIDVRLLSWSKEAIKRDPEVEAEAGRFDKPTPFWDLHLFSSTIGGAEEVREFFSSLLSHPGKHAFQAVFERNYVEPEIVHYFNQMTGVWCQCSANYDVLQRCGVKNAVLIPLPYFDDDPLLGLEPPKQHRHFYWIGRFEPRKAPDNLIRAFMRAFKPGEAMLTLKLSPLPGSIPYPSPEAVILEQLTQLRDWDVFNWRESIIIMREKLNGAQMQELHARNDVYVSASRGEGMELGAYAAKLAGRTLLMTDSGAPRDYLTEHDVLVPATGQIDAVADYRWGAGATYNDYSLDVLATALQSVRGAAPSGDRHLSSFKASNVASQFKEWIEQCVFSSQG